MCTISQSEWEAERAQLGADRSQQATLCYMVLHSRAAHRLCLPPLPEAIWGGGGGGPWRGVRPPYCKHLSLPGR